MLWYVRPFQPCRVVEMGGKGREGIQSAFFFFSISTFFFDILLRLRLRLRRAARA